MNKLIEKKSDNRYGQVQSKQQKTVDAHHLWHARTGCQIKLLTTTATRLVKVGVSCNSHHISCVTRAHVATKTHAAAVATSCGAKHSAAAAIVVPRSCHVFCIRFEEKFAEKHVSNDLTAAVHYPPSVWSALLKTWVVNFIDRSLWHIWNTDLSAGIERFEIRSGGAKLTRRG